MARQESRHIAKAQAELAAGVLDPKNAWPMPSAAPQSSLLDAYERITRSIRRSIMLYMKLVAPVKQPASQQRIAARKRIIRDVEDAIQSKAPADEQEKLHAELLERLDRPDLEYDIANRPIADIVTDMCRDLGIAGLYDAHPWKRRIPHDIDILNARAEQVAGAAASQKLRDLLASAPPPPPRTGTILTVDVSTLPDDEGESRQGRRRRCRDP